MFVGAKNYLEEIIKLQAQQGQTPVSLAYDLAESEPPLPTPPQDYDLEHSMLKSSYSKSTDSFLKKEYSSTKQPTRFFMHVIAERIRQSGVNICVVALPMNSLFLKRGQQDVEQVENEMLRAFSEIPRENFVNLLGLGREPYVFRDTMHFTEYGQARVVAETFRSPCLKRLAKNLAMEIPR